MDVKETVVIVNVDGKALVGRVLSSELVQDGSDFKGGEIKLHIAFDDEQPPTGRGDALRRYWLDRALGWL